MSLWEVTLWTWGRSVLIAVLALPLVSLLVRELGSQSPGARRWWFGAMLLPLITPGFFVGYAYGRGVLALRELQVWNELCYVLLSVGRWTPLGVLVVCLAPRSFLSAEGWHCYRMSLRTSRRGLARFREMGVWLGYGEGKKFLLAGGILFLASFHDFDLAALMGVQSWSVWLFDAQAAGLSLKETLSKLVFPLVVQGVTVGPILWSAGRGWVRGTEGVGRALEGISRVGNGRGGKALAWSWLAGAGLAGSLVPWGLVIFEGRQGFGSIWRQGNQWLGLLQEGMNGIVAGGTAAFLAIGVSRWVCGREIRTGKGGMGGRWLWVVPGLLGPLAIGLVCLTVFQWGGVSRVIPGGMRWLLALVVWLIPYGVLMQFAVRNLTAPEPLHLVEMMRGSPRPDQRRTGMRMWWEMRGDEWLWTCVPLAYWGYFDLTISSMLAPAGSVSAPVRLFNLMHYGHSSMLSALTGGAVLIPVAIVSALWLFRTGGVVKTRGSHGLRPGGSE